jgi:S-adenosylmethionine hydrolase
MKNRIKILALLVIFNFLFLLGSNATGYCSEVSAITPALVIQTDFGTKDGSVCEMKGVAYGINPELKISDLTQEIPFGNIWDAGYRLIQTAPSWPKGTIFVSVVDPDVGTGEKSIILKTKTGQYFVSPDNGTLTLIAEQMGIEQAREIDKKINQRPGSGESYTFYGRDVYIYTAARLAAGKITFEQVGPVLNHDIVMLKYLKPSVKNGVAVGTIPVLDVPFGNVFTNISREMFDKLGVKTNELLKVKIYHKGKLKYKGTIPFVKTFGDVPEGSPLAYYNSLMNLSFAINMGNFSAINKVSSGLKWTVRVEKAAKN